MFSIISNIKSLMHKIFSYLLMYCHFLFECYNKSYQRLQNYKEFLTMNWYYTPFIFIEVNDLKALPYHGLKTPDPSLQRRNMGTARVNNFHVDNSKNGQRKI